MSPTNPEILYDKSNKAAQKVLRGRDPVR